MESYQSINQAKTLFNSKHFSQFDLTVHYQKLLQALLALKDAVRFLQMPLHYQDPTIWSQRVFEYLSNADLFELINIFNSQKKANDFAI